MQLRHFLPWFSGLGMSLVLLAPAHVAFAQAPTKEKGIEHASASKKPSIYDKNADAKVQLAEATARAKREDKRVLVMFGGDWCGWCHKLHELFAANAQIRKLLSYEYELVMIADKAPHAQELMSTCYTGEKHPGYPFLAVMDSSGKLLIGQETGSLEEGEHHDPKKVKDFLAKWVIEPKDAQVVLRDALARASSEEKKVFLTFGAPWCGWCHRLENFLALPEISAILDRDFVVIKIDTDRMTGGKDALKRFRSDDSGGIPWYAVLDSKGEKLATSDLLEGRVKNIGYPAEPKEIDAFMTLIEGNSRRIEPAQVAQVHKELETAGAKIVSDMKQRAAEAAAKKAEKKN